MLVCQELVVLLIFECIQFCKKCISFACPLNLYTNPQHSEFDTRSTDVRGWGNFCFFYSSGSKNPKGVGWGRRVPEFWGPKFCEKKGMFKAFPHMKGFGDMVKVKMTWTRNWREQDNKHQPAQTMGEYEIHLWQKILLSLARRSYWNEQITDILWVKSTLHLYTRPCPIPAPLPLARTSYWREQRERQKLVHNNISLLGTSLSHNQRSIWWF